jgi:hypothetical protein
MSGDGDHAGEIFAGMSGDGGKRLRFGMKEAGSTEKVTP